MTATVAALAIAELENLRTKLHHQGPVPPGAETFINEMTLLITATGSPRKALDIAFRVLASEPAEGAQA
ncbi:hypothetical protein ABZU94_07135 [Streptomyces mirabilis]|uniref:hypothetical protein n=1 Tax=Streptomyces sp. NPDC005388 TaxID=3156717 RepID=UPI0033AA31ED